MSETWVEANQIHLSAHLNRVHRLVEPGPEAHLPAPDTWTHARKPAIDNIADTFQLSAFEKDLLLLCAGVEMNTAVADACAARLGDPGHRHATFALALGVLGEAHWSALSPGGPLRRWRLIELGPGSLSEAPLRIDERILHHLAGIENLDVRISPVTRSPHTEILTPSLDTIAERLARAWHADAPPVLHLVGRNSRLLEAVGAAVCARAGFALVVLAADMLPENPGDLATLARLFQREALLSGVAVMVDATEASDSGQIGRVGRFVSGLGTPVLVAGRDRRRAWAGATVSADVPVPGPDEQRALWLRELGASGAALNGTLDALVGQFRLDGESIRAACVDARARSHARSQARAADDLDGPAEPDDLWDACRAQTSPLLDDLAQRIEVRTEWKDLVLPPDQMQVLREIVARARHQLRVHRDWGFGASGRGLGLGVLFSGPSGTGKTLAAEVLATELRLDLYRVDLSQVVSKYIGETEKNLRRVFDAAENGGSILLFDEADALFGKRSEVKDAHDRYANVEVSYLLQRMEAYRGLAILTTNLPEALDQAFLRRLAFIVRFPFPSPAQREAMWERVFPPQTPTAGLNGARLAQLNVAGGTIRNVALQAAFLAASEDQPVTMEHLLRAARREASKSERGLGSGETRGWG